MRIPPLSAVRCFESVARHASVTLAAHGVALVRIAFVQAELAARQLVAVKAPSLQSPLAYRLVYLPDVLIDPALRQFRDWLMRQRPPQA